MEQQSSAAQARRRRGRRDSERVTQPAPPDPTVSLEPMAALSYPFSIRCDDGPLAARLRALFGPLARPTVRGATPAPDHDVHVYDVRRHAEGRVHLLLDGSELACVDNGVDAVAYLVWDVTQRAVRATTDELLFHAGGVDVAGSGVLLPGPSGSGKSTLVAALVRDGARCLSDELMAVRLEPPMLLPYPKPITLKSGSLALFDDLLGTDPPADSGWPGSEWPVGVEHVRAGGTATAVRPAAVVMPRYGAGLVTSVRAMAHSEAFLGLAVNTVNLDRHGESGLRLLAELSGRCRCVVLEYSDVMEACAALRNVLDA